MTRLSPLSPQALGGLRRGSLAFGRAGATAMLSLSLGAGALAQEKITYQDQVLPLIETHCAKCHNPDKKKADLDLTSYNGLMKGSGSGQIVASANLDGSKLWRSLSHAEEPTMPPNKPKLPDKELDVFKKWIVGGLLETSGSKAIAASKSSVDLTLGAGNVGKPDGSPPMPDLLPLEPVVHATRGNPIVGLAGSPWAPLLAVAGQKQVLLFHTDDLELVGILPFGDGQPVDVKFSRNSKLLLAGGGVGAQSGRVVVWDVTTGERLMTVGKEYDAILAADISPDQSHVALGGPDRLVKIFSTKSGAIEHKKKKHTDWITALAFSPNGEFLASGDRNGGISIWDPDNGQELFTLAGHKAGVTALSWRDDSKVLASASEDGAVKLWESQEGKQVKTWAAHTGGALDVCYAHDGRLVTCGRDQKVVVWDASGNKTRTLDFEGDLVLRAVFSHDSARVFATDFAGRVGAWKVADGKRLGVLEANPAPLAERIAAAEKRLAELQGRGDKPSAELSAAEAEVAEAAAQLEKADATLQEARATQTTREAETAKLKELATRPNPPADLQAKLAASRAERNKARAATTNAMQVVEKATQQATEARQKLASMKKSDDPAAALAEARAALPKLKAAQSFATVFKARETLTAQKRTVEELTAAAAEKKDALKKAEDDLNAATDPAEKSKLKSALKTAKTEARDAEAALEKATKALATEEARVKKLNAEFEKMKTAAAGTVQQSRL